MNLLGRRADQIRLRIARGRELLARTRSVKRVSAELGFADQSHFGRHSERRRALRRLSTSVALRDVQGLTLGACETTAALAVCTKSLVSARCQPVTTMR